MSKLLDVNIIRASNLKLVSPKSKLLCEAVLINTNGSEISGEKFTSVETPPTDGSDQKFEFRDPIQFGQTYTITDTAFFDLKITIYVKNVFTANTNVGEVQLKHLNENASVEGPPQTLQLIEKTSGEHVGDLVLTYGLAGIDTGTQDDIIKKNGFPFPDGGDGHPNELHVLVLKARNLPTADMSLTGGSSDPFVTLKVGSDKQKTTTKMNNVNPEWNEKFVFQVDDASQYLEASVYDFDKGRVDEFLGKTVLPFDLGLEDKQMTRELKKLGPKSTGQYDGTDRGTLELVVQWVHNPSVVVEKSFFQRLVRKDSSEEEDDEPEEEEEEEEEEKDERTPEEKEEAEKKAAEAKKQLESELEDIEIKSGDYSFTIQVMEARDLKGEDVDGLSDPVVYVEVLGEKVATSVVSKTLNPVFDETFVVQKRNLDKEEFENGQIIFKVMDADTLKKNDMIGAYTFDASFVYANKDHEIYHKWLALTDPTDAKDTGIQGYLKMSVIITGPGDKMKRHNEEKEREEEQKQEAEQGIEKLVLMPSSQKQETKFLVTKVFEANYLPQLDGGGRSLIKGGIDAFVSVKVGATKPLRTKIKKLKGDRSTLNPDFYQELWVPIQVPNFGAKATYAVYDWDAVGANELVAMSYQTFKEINKSPGRKYKAHWVNLYGAPLSGYRGPSSPATRRYITKCNTYPEMGTTFRGKLLLEQYIADKLPEKYEEIKPFKRRISRKKVRRVRTATQKLVLRAMVISGTEIPKFHNIGVKKWKQMRLRISCGIDEVYTELVDNKEGSCTWKQLLETAEMLLPVDAKQIPDIFIHLLEGKGPEASAVAFCRLKAEDILHKGLDSHPAGSRVPHKGPQCEWYRLQEDRCLNLLDEGEFPGSVLIQLGMGSPEEAEATRDSWKKEVNAAKTTTTYQLRINIYQAEDLPSEDPNGLMDPYIRVKFQDQDLRTPTKKQTVNPLWYHTLIFECELPDTEYMPQVTLLLYDHDITTDDYAGCVQFPLSQAAVFSENPDPHDPNYEPTPPKWLDFMKEKPGDCEGRVLVSFELIKVDPGAQLLEAPDITPKLRKAYIEVIALGVRDVIPYKMVPMQLPFLKFKLTSASETFEASTNTSKKPNASNANFLQRIVIEVDLPEDPIFTPKLKLRLFDTRLGGFHKPLVGAAAVDMEPKIPWGDNPEYKPPQAQAFSKTEEMKNADAPALPEDDGVGIGMALRSTVASSPLNSGTTESKGHEGEDLETKEDEEEDSDEEEEEEEAKYMKGRAVLDTDLETFLGSKPFEDYELYRGGKGDGPGAYGRKVVGKFKGLIRVMEREDEPPLFNFDELLKPENYKIRLYILEAKNLTPMDVGFMGKQGKSDPYVLARLGKDEFNDAKNYIQDTVNADLYKMIEFDTQLPGTSQLEIQIMDHDDIGHDELIGKTTIDLEDRWFNEKWKELGKENMVDPTTNPDPTKTENLRYSTKPLEIRDLYVPTSTAPQGALQCWVDILKPSEASVFVADNVSLPPKMIYEVRVVIWKTKDCVSMEAISNMNDMFAKVWIEGCEKQETDTHWRAKKGKASFNWRMKFDVLLGHNTRAMKFPYMHIQLWDRDIIKWNDVIGEGMEDLGKHFKKAFRKKQPLTLYTPKRSQAKKEGILKKTPSAQTTVHQPLNDEEEGNIEEEVTEDATDESTELISSIKSIAGLEDNPMNSKWMTLEKTDHNKGTKTQMGKVCFSVSIYPKDLADKQPVGHGRSAPNINPYCPPPVGRLKFSLNPFSMFYQLLGPKACCAFLCCLICIVLVVLMIYCGPFLNLLIALFVN